MMCLVVRSSVKEKMRDKCAMERGSTISVGWSEESSLDSI